MANLLYDNPKIEESPLFISVAKTLELLNYYDDTQPHKNQQLPYIQIFGGLLNVIDIYFTDSPRINGIII